MRRVGLEICASSGSRMAGIAGCTVKHRRHLVANGAVRTHLIVVDRPSPHSIQIAALHRIEFTILAGDQIIGKREARHRLEASRPSLEVGPVGDLKPALGT